MVFDDGKKDFGEFRTLFMEKGHSVTLIVRSEGKAMVGLHEKKSTITLGEGKTDCSFLNNIAFSDDRLAMMLEFTTSDPVKMDADGKIKIGGGLQIALTTGKAETRSAPFEVKVGTAVTFPGDGKDLPELKVKSAGKSEPENDVFEIEFSTNRHLEDFAGFKFYTKDGDPVEAWVRVDFLELKESGDFSYCFRAMPTDLILAIETWTGREDINLKVDLSAGLVLPKP